MGMLCRIDRARQCYEQSVARRAPTPHDSRVNQFQKSGCVPNLPVLRLLRLRCRTLQRIVDLLLPDSFEVLGAGQSVL